MKRILSSVVALFILFSCATDCDAAEYKDASTGDVYGEYVFCANEGMHMVMPDEGSYEVKTDDGVQIEVGGAKTELPLVIHRIPEKETECYDWIKSCLPEAVVSFVPYEVFFVDSSAGKVKLPSGMHISISENDDEACILWLSYSGEVKVLPHTVADKKIAFETVEGGGYYLVCKTMGQIDTPDTGDNMNRQFWTVLLVAAFAVFALTTKLRTAKRNSRI